MVFGTDKSYEAIELATKVADATDVTNDYVNFSMDRKVTNVIAQIKAATTGVVNSAGLAITITDVANTSCTVKVAATAIASGDVISLIAW